MEVAPLGRGPIEAVLRYSANLEAESEVQVYSQAARLVTELLVEEGDAVAKGQVLLRLQDEEQTSKPEAGRKPAGQGAAASTTGKRASTPRS